MRREINNPNRWYNETDEFSMELVAEDDEDNVNCYRVCTNKYYQQGRRYQEFWLTKTLVENESNERIIEILSNLMRHDIDLLIAHGIIRE